MQHGIFALHHSLLSDHCGVQCTCTIRERRERQRRRQAKELGAPLRLGVRARIGKTGVARRPYKAEACAKIEPHTEKNEGGPTYYCSKHHGKPRVPTGEAAIIEGPHQKGLWRISLPRNCPYVHSHAQSRAHMHTCRHKCSHTGTPTCMHTYISPHIQT